MKTHIKWNLKKGETRSIICDSIARHLWQFFRMREMDGKIGIENTATNDELRTEVAKLINKKKWIKTEDRINNVDRYQLFIERQTRQAINKLIDPSKGNTLFMPGLLNNPFVGYFIACDDTEIQTVHKDKRYHIDGCLHNLEHRTHEARTYVEKLPAHIKEKLIDDGKNREIV